MRKCSLVIDVRPGERLDLGGIVQVELVQKSGQLARLRVTAPRDITIQKKGDGPGDKPVASMAN